MQGSDGPDQDRRDHEHNNHRDRQDQQRLFRRGCAETDILQVRCHHRLGGKINYRGWNTAIPGVRRKDPYNPRSEAPKEGVGCRSFAR